MGQGRVERSALGGSLSSARQSPGGHQEMMSGGAWCQPPFAQQQSPCGLSLPCPYIVSAHHYLIKQNQSILL
ncbi:hypothetical protein E2562_038024 [Oryza meyeriana var. granulata]|uniref:Uncharacterized protein n=1 Tax=Oryza meyeriana var. granulata TaxID=110450 RepID=A0A6G1EDN5_9ORYZ|nr:hypothetical protein E2562_038024 [Oryza meyeriana var. granulata]